MRFSRQGYWSGLPFPSPGDLPNPGIEPESPALQADPLPTELQGKPHFYVYMLITVSQFIPSPVLGNNKFVFCICGSISVLQIGSFVLFFVDSTYKQYHMIFVFLCLTY